MALNVCPDNIFRTIKHFVTKPGKAMKHHTLFEWLGKNVLEGAEASSLGPMHYSSYAVVLAAGNIVLFR